MEGRGMQTTSKSEEAGWWTCYQRSSRMNILQLLLCCYKPCLWELLEMFSFSSQTCSTSKFCWWKWRHCILNAFLMIVISCVSTITIHFILQHASQIKTTSTRIWWRRDATIRCSLFSHQQHSLNNAQKCKLLWQLAAKRCWLSHTRQVFKGWCQSVVLFVTHCKCAILTTLSHHMTFHYWKGKKCVGWPTQASWLYMFLWPGVQMEALCLLNWKKKKLSIYVNECGSVFFLSSGRCLADVRRYNYSSCSSPLLQCVHAVHSILHKHTYLSINHRKKKLWDVRYSGL